MDIYQSVSAFYKAMKTPKRIIGKSVLNRNIYAVKVGDGAPVGIVQYALHAREYITAQLAFIHAQVGVYHGTLWLVPLCNPDGALLVQKGLSSVRDVRQKQRLLQLNGNSGDFSLWKANARGVDLNVNFAAAWGKGVHNVRVAGSENYIGKKPFSEPETRALKAFTLQIRPDYTLSYHTKGEEIYWYFHQSPAACVRDVALGQCIAESTGYPLRTIEGSVGGYKDWCIQTLGIPSFTIEAGKDEYAHPLGEAALLDIIKKNKYAVYELSKGMIQ